jgi:hypothetical protein
MPCFVVDTDPVSLDWIGEASRVQYQKANKQNHFFHFIRLLYFWETSFPALLVTKLPRSPTQ